MEGFEKWKSLAGSFAASFPRQIGAAGTSVSSGSTTPLGMIQSRISYAIFLRSDAFDMMIIL